MSRFFEASDSESDEGSQSEGDVAGLGGELLAGFQENTGPGPTLQHRFTFDESDSEDERRVVRTQKEKRFDELQSTIKSLKNHMKIRDFVNIEKEFDRLQNQISNPKLSATIKAEGVPRFYLKAVVSLQDFIEQSFADKAGRKKLSPTNAKALSKLRQYLTKKNKLFVKELKEYKLNPDEEKDLDSEEEEDDEFADSDEPRDEDDDEEDDETDWGTDSSESDSDEEGFSLDQNEITRDFWVKKAVTEDSQKRKRKKPKTAKEKKKLAIDDEESTKQQIDWTPELIQKKLQEVFKARGRANFDKRQAMLDLQDMNQHAEGAMAKVAVLCALIGTLNDMNLNKSTYMNIKLWNQCLSVLNELVDVLRSSPEIRLKELDEDGLEEEDLYDEEPEVDEFAQAEEAQREREREKERERAKIAEESKEEVDETAGFETIRGNLYAFVLSLAREYRKSLQFLDFNEPSYAERQKDEAALLSLVRKCRDYYSFISNRKGESRMCSILLDHIYPIYDERLDVHADPSPEVLAEGESRVNGEVGEADEGSSHSQYSCFSREGFHQPKPVLETPHDEIQELCSFIYREGDSRSKTHALLQRVTHYAIHNRFADARDLLLISHLAESISNADVATKILFNRTQAYLALAAFRSGRYLACMRILAEIYTTQRIKEILAQGVSSTRWSDRDLQQEQIERKRTYPNHLHISLDLLESCHLVSAMLLEIPSLALNPTDDRKYQISRMFRRLYDGFLSEAFHGPPENTRDYINHASIALSKGNWRECNGHCMALKMWSLTQNEEKVRARLTKRIKESSLQTYIVVYGPQYRTLCLSNLSLMFDLPERDVTRIISRMIATKDLSGSIDQPGKTMTVHMQSPGYLQKMALSYADKLSSFVDQNEKLLESVSGRGGYQKRSERGEGGGGGDFLSRGDKPRGDNPFRGPRLHTSSAPQSTSRSVASSNPWGRF